jgi:PAS domain S-box-containing protein
MVPNTALALFCASLALWLSRDRSGGWRRRLAIAVVGLTLFVASGALLEYALGRSLGIDTVIVRVDGEVGTGFPNGRPEPTTAVGLSLIALSLLLLDARRSRALVEVLLAAVAALAIVPLAGYVYGAASLYAGDRPHTGVGPHTAISMLLLAVGILCARPATGTMAIVTSPGAGGLMARRLLVGAAAVPVIGLLIVLGARAGLGDQAFASALLAITATVIALWLILSTARLLDRLDRERRAAEEALRVLVERGVDGIFVTDRDGHYIDVNEAGCRILRSAYQDIVGKPIADFLCPQDLPRLSVELARVLSGSEVRGEWEMRRGDGNFVFVEVTAKLLPDGRLQGMVRDISERKAHEREIARAHASELAAVKEVERMREEWTSIIAHDLRQPVNVISLGVHLLDRAPPEQQAGLRERIRLAAGRLDRMIGDLLDLSRLEAQALRLDRCEIEPRRMVDEALDHLEHLVSGRDVRVVDHGPALSLQADPGRIEQVLGNLLSNAVKYGSPGTPILIDIDRRPEEVTISVANSGQGIPQHELPRLFGRFVRSAEARRSEIPGLGVGLYISRGIVEAHGGRIWVESAPDGLTNFRFTLPVVQTAEAGAHRAAPASGWTHATSDPHRSSFEPSGQ